jgi:DNA mismatch repair protein MutH
MSRFDYRYAVEEDIVRFARTMVGKTFGQLGSLFSDRPAAKGKGEIGFAIEQFFGMPANTRSAADFSRAGIELKAVPLVRSGSGMRSKERTVIGMINYMKIVDEEWSSAHVRSKLDILFIFYEHMFGVSKADFPVRQALLWRPKAEEPVLRRDWERVRDKVKAGLAHELSEGDGRLLGPCTKAADSSKRIRQPITTFSVTAKPRAFALKPSFTSALYQMSTGSLDEMQSLMASLEVDDVDDFEEALLRRYGRFVGRELGDVADELEIAQSTGKGYAASVVRRALGAKSVRAKLREFEEMGITVRTTRVSPEMFPYEAMSFPAFRYMQLVDEEWTDSALLDQLDGLFIFPLEGVNKGTIPARCIIRRPTLWRPSAEDLETAEREWTMFRDLIASGSADALPTASATSMLHVRPHGRDSSDTDLAPVVGQVVKKSFWLNRGFVQKLLLRSHP